MQSGSQTQHLFYQAKCFTAKLSFWAQCMFHTLITFLFPDRSEQKERSKTPPQEERVSWITRLTEGLPRCSNSQFTPGKVSAVTWKDAYHHWLKEARSSPQLFPKGKKNNLKSTPAASWCQEGPAAQVWTVLLLSVLSITWKSLLSSIHSDFHQRKFPCLAITAILNTIQSKNVVFQKVTGEQTFEV